MEGPKAGVVSVLEKREVGNHSDVRVRSSCLPPNKIELFFVSLQPQSVKH